MKKVLLGTLLVSAMPILAQQLADGEIRKMEKKAGDKVKFQAEMLAGGKVAVTRIEPAK